MQCFVYYVIHATFEDLTFFTAIFYASIAYFMSMLYYCCKQRESKRRKRYAAAKNHEDSYRLERII